MCYRHIVYKKLAIIALQKTPIDFTSTVKVKRKICINKT